MPVIRKRQGCFQIVLAPIRKLDGTLTSSYTWEAILRDPKYRVLGCGTSIGRMQAEADANVLIERNKVLAHRKVA